MTRVVEPVSSFLGPIPLRTYAPRDHAAHGVVLLFHGLRTSADAHDKEARSLAAAGMVAILPDAPHHGRRRSAVLDTMPDALGIEGHRVLLRILREARDEVPLLVDHALALGHPRVAIAGISMGAYIALAAATVERRLAAIVSILGSPDWTPRGGDVPEDLARWVADESPHHRLEAFPPRPLLLVNGGRDENVRPEPARDFAARLRPLYEASGGGPLIHRELPDAGHCPSEADWNELWSGAVAFLGRELA
jgi:alpha-beta hydrolase superfamily lysophospholipase